MFFKCRYCKKDIVSQDNKAHIYYPGDDSDDPEPYYFVHVTCSKAHTASISGKSIYERGSGELTCEFCKKGVSGEALIKYKYEDDYVDETFIFHRACEKPYRLFKAGKIHKCPKCEGLGTITVNNSICQLCDGDGMLEKPAVPIDWKKAT